MNVLLVFLTMLVVVFLFVYFIFWKTIISVTKKKDEAKRVFGLISLMISVSLSLCFLDISIKRIQNGTSIMNNGLVEHVFAQDERIFSWDERIQGKELFEPVSIEEKMVLNLLVKNTILRKLEYTISVVSKKDIPSIEKSYQAFHNLDDNARHEFLKQVLYLINNDEILWYKFLDFYNPSDKEQQEKFNNLLSNYLNPELDLVGLEVQKTEFRIIVD